MDNYHYNTLTVDDNPTVLESMLELLSRIDPDGKHLTAGSGREALELMRGQSPDIAFLDIEMPGGSGLDLAFQLNKLRSDINIIFITGYAEYAMQAFELYASGYLLKPVTEAQIRKALDNLRHPVSEQREKRLKAQCFGTFEAWCDGSPIKFGRSKTKALLAFLIDRNGAMCDTGQILCALWPEEPDSVSHRNQIRVFISDLQTTFTKLNIGDALIRRHGQIGINTKLVDCDYYDYLRGTSGAENRFNGEYMSQYSFGEVTLAGLTAEI